jgi:hypothetical protein
LTVKGRKNIERFRQIVKESNLLCDFYTTIDSLKYVVAISIRRTIEECPAVGWVRSNQINDFQTQTIKQLQDILIMMKNTQLEQKQILCENISVEANTLLRGACKESAGGIIIVARTLSGTSVSAGKQVFCDEATSCLEAVWISAIEELVKKEYIQDSSGKKELYRVTRNGYEYNNKSDISRPLREKGLDDIDIAIVNTMKHNSECTVSEISNMIGYSQCATIRRIQKLKEKGIIERIGSGKFGMWNLR